MHSGIQKVFSHYHLLQENNHNLESEKFLLQDIFRVDCRSLGLYNQGESEQNQTNQMVDEGSSEQQDSKKNYVNVILALTEHHIILMQETNSQRTFPTYYTKLDFDVKFQVLRNTWKDQMTPGQALGIRIERINSSNKVQFYSHRSHVVQLWRKCLEKKINQRNFHQLFKAKKKIGKGAFATVYLAQRLIDKQMVAVKAFSKEKQFSTKNGRESLINQIKILRDLNHPNVAHLEGIYETENSLYMTLQILEGNQLHESLKSKSQYSQYQVRKIIRCLLKAINHLAHKRIIHRDIKPENIMFKRKDSLEITLCDFGLATYADQNEYLFVRCGTPGFVAPEIINIKDMSTKSDPISDVFSTGVIFHFFLLGHSVFPGKKYNEVLVQNRACNFNFSTQEYITVPPPALDLLKKMLQVNPNKRFSAEQCLKHPYFANSMEYQQIEDWKNPIIQQQMTDLSQQQMKFKQLSRKMSQKVAQGHGIEEQFHIFYSPLLQKGNSSLMSQKSSKEGNLLAFNSWKRQDSFFKDNSGTPNGNKLQLLYKKTSTSDKENVPTNSNPNSLFKSMNVQGAS